MPARALGPMRDWGEAKEYGWRPVIWSPVSVKVTSADPTFVRPRPDHISPGEWRTRVDLAACYRLMALFGFTDLIYNHITARVEEDGHFLINPYGLLYEEVTASGLHKIDLDGRYVLRGDPVFEINHAGYVVHSAIHMGRADAGCVIHTHSRAATAVSAMECGLLPLSQSAMLFHDGVSYHDYEGGVVDLAERERLLTDLGGNNVMILRNHGTLVVGRSPPQAFLLAYQLENACRIQVDAMAAARPLLPAESVAAKVGRMAKEMNATYDAHLEWGALLRLLARRNPGHDT